MPAIIVHGVMYINFDKHDFPRFRIQQYDLTCLVKLGYRDNAHLLTRRTFDNGRIELRLVADKVDMWTLLDHELIFFLEWIAP